jgi:chemotaxis protein MotB
MQFTTLRFFLLFFAATFMMSSCVSKKKFEELMNEKGALAESLASSQKKVQELDEKIAQLESDMAAQKTDFEGRITSLESDLSTAKSETAAAKAALSAKEAEVMAVKKQVKDAFAVTGNLGLTEKNGAMVVSLESPVTYGSGSTRLNKDARMAIDNLAETMKNNPSMSLLIEGHTDDKKFVSGGRDNWDLSVDRAMRVVKRLVKKGVNPSQLTVAGRGDAAPAASNETKEGRSENRRAVVKPSLNTGELYKIGN